tara:strand:+ start:179 stop:382 length:204 start_codon:yes stop_codon:yes gene_type:complete
MNVAELVEEARSYGPKAWIPVDLAEQILEYGISELLLYCPYYECLNLLEQAEISVKRAHSQAITFLH